MAAFTTRIDPAIAGYNPMAQFNENQKASADVANTEATTAHTQAQVPLIQQQTQAASLANQQAARDLRDQQILTDALRSGGGDQTKTVMAARASGASAKAVYGLMNGLTEYQKNKAMADLESNKVDIQNHEQAGGLIDAVIAAPPELKQETWDKNIADGIARGVLHQGELPPQYPGDDRAQVFSNSLKLQGGILGDIVKKQTIAKDTADAAEKTAQAAKANSDAEFTGLKIKAVKAAIDAFQKDPGSGGSVINGVLPSSLDAQANASYTASWMAAMRNGDTEAAQKVVEAAATHAANLSQQLNPKLRTAKISDDVTKENALIPGKVAAGIQIEKGKAALAGPMGAIVDPQQRSHVENILDSAQKDYGSKVSEADRLKELVQQARNGNQTAAGLLTVDAVRTIVNRVNGQELSAAGGGSIGRRIENAASKGWQGRPSEDTLKDLEQFADVSRDVAKKSYKSTVGSVNSRYLPPDKQLPDEPFEAGRPLSTSAGTNRPPLSSFEKK